MRISRRHFISTLCGTAFLGLGGSYMRYFEPSWFEVNHEKLKLSILRTKGTLKVLHLSDLHASEWVPYKYIDMGCSLGLEENPDLICLTGDFITWHLHDEVKYKKILKKLSCFAPTYACIGNHDGGRWAGSTHGYKDFIKVKQLLLDSEITFLFNASVREKIKNHNIEIVGLGDLWSGDLKPSKVLKRKREEQCSIIVLSHNPDCKIELENYDWDLMLCGHTHGGQIKIPLLNATPFAPVRDKNFIEGLHHWQKRYIHITKGIGNLHGMRLNCRPQVSIITI